MSGGQLGQQGMGMGGGQGYGGARQSPFGSNPMQTRPWMQQGYNINDPSTYGGRKPMSSGLGGDPNQYTTGLWRGPRPDNGQPQTGGNDVYPDSGMHPVQQQQYQPYGPQSGPMPPPSGPVYPQNPIINTMPPGGNVPNHLAQPWDRKPGDPGYFPASGITGPGGQQQPMTGGNDYETSGMHPIQQQLYRPFTEPPRYDAQASGAQQTGGQDYQNAQAPQAAQQQPQSWAQQNAGLLRPRDPREETAYTASAAPQIPPGPGNPNTPPPSQMQNGQVGWEWNAGTSGINPQGWNAQFTPGYQQYISSGTAGLNQQQRGQINYNDLVASLGRVTGQQYNPSIYGAR